MSRTTIGREIGENLRLIAKARGFSQGQVAINAGVSAPTISQLFNGGTVDPPIGTVLKIAKVLGVSLDELVGLKPLEIPEPEPVVSDSDRLAVLERGLLETREQLAKLADALGDAAEARAAEERSKLPGKSKRAS